MKLELERYDQAIEKRADAVTRSNSELRLIGVPVEPRSQSPGAASQALALLSDQQVNDFQTKLRDLIATRRAHINERTAELTSKLDEIVKQKDKARGICSLFISWHSNMYVQCCMIEYSVV